MTEDRWVKCNNCNNHYAIHEVSFNEDYEQWWCVDCFKGAGYIKCECCEEWFDRGDVVDSKEMGDVCINCFESWGLSREDGE
jgi:hypothetical protein